MKHIKQKNMQKRGNGALPWPTPKQKVTLSMFNLIIFQGLEDDEKIKSVFPAVFMLSYYNRVSSNDYAQFVKEVKDGSLEKFGYQYEEDEEVSAHRCSIFRW